MLTLYGTSWILSSFQLIIFISSSMQGTKNEIQLLPRGRVSVCSNDEQLSFTCNTTNDILMWSVTIPESGANSRFDSTSRQNIQPIEISGKLFKISRLSTNGTVPLISILSVTNTTDLNGTNIECSIQNTNFQMVSTIHVIRSDVYPQPLNISSTETFNADSVAVDLEWKEEPCVTYITDIVPQTPSTSTESARLQLTLSYNRVYNVTITAFLCGQNSEDTTLIISYETCPNTFREGLLHSADRDDVFLKGTTVTFTCPPGLVLNGPNTSMCMENGEWEPGTKEVKCKADCGTPLARSDVSLIFNSTLEGSQLIFWCDESPNEASCLSDGRWSIDLNQYNCRSTEIQSRESHNALVIVSISSVILFATIFFILGCIIGQLWQKHKQSTVRDIQDAQLQPSQVHASSSTDNTAIPTEQDMEMMKNAAYGPLKYTAT